MNAFNRLHTKILSLILAMITIVLAISLWSILNRTYTHSEQLLSNRLAIASNVVQHTLQADMALIQRSLRNIGQDFTMKQLIASGNDDPDSLLSAFNNFQRRIQSDIILVVSPKDNIIASTRSLTLKTIPFSVTNLAENTLTIIELDNTYYLAKSVPVKYVERSPQPDAWLIAGLKLDSVINQELVNLSGFDVTLMTQDNTGDQRKYNVLSSTLNQETYSDLQTQQELPLGQFVAVDISYQGYIAQRFALGTQGLLPVYLTLTTLTTDAFLSFHSLIGHLFIVIFISLVLAFLITYFVSKGVTRPLNSLVNIARSISQGDYSNKIPPSSTYEVQSLSDAFIAMQGDIKIREQEINQLAYFDPLTQLPNRNHFYSQLAQRLEQKATSKPEIAVLQIDIDRFKEVNDTLGHDFGDQLLKAIAERLQTFSDKNIFIAHLSADVFAVIFSKLNTVPLTTIIEQFHQYFELPFVIDGVYLDLNASIGIACYPEHADTAPKLMQCADIALNACKNKHTYYQVYEAKLNTHSVMRLSLLSELKAAIASDQLELFYQPKLDLKQNKVLAVECLVRWHHPTHGFVQPDEFIPLAEQSGHIRDLTHWAIKTALKQHKEWKEAGYSLQMAVNISAIDLIDFKLPVYTTEMLAEYNLTADILKLEVTESAVMSEPEQAIKALSMLSTMGIKLSIDDFGTGFSSMAQLKKMPVNELKVDKSFVLELASNDDDEVIVRSTIELAHNLNLSVVAEGVEDLETMAMLTEMGCDVAQGYYLSKPMPKTDFPDWWAKNTIDDQSFKSR